MQPTVVRFPTGATGSTGRVLAIQPAGTHWAVITDATPFHPVDHTWPDQPADRGSLAGLPVVDCVVGAQSPQGELLLGSEIPVRRGDPAWTWVVVHLLDAPAQDLPVVGQEVELAVDAELRRGLSIAHTACHLAALALNEATAGLWRKEPPHRDSLGNPDFDGAAIQRSRITPYRSVDEYRLGKSIRKRGLDTAGLLDGLETIEQTVNARLAQWIATGAPVAIQTGGDDSVVAHRRWTCALPDAVATYPCGGTHVASLAELPAATRVRYEAVEAGMIAETLAD